MKKTQILILFILLLVLQSLIISAQIDTVSLILPQTNSWSNQGNPSTINFNFNYTGNTTNASCELFIDSAGFGSNATTLNNTNTIIQNNATVSEGARNWNVTCTDSYSSTLTSTTYTLNIDRSTPTTSASAVLSNSSSYTFNTWTNSAYVNITLNCNDGSGIGCNTTLHCTDTANSCSPNTAYTSSLQISTEDVSYIRYKTNDTLGNDETVNSQTIRIDTILPIFTINNGTEIGPVATDILNIVIADNSTITTSEYGYSPDNTCNVADTYGNAFTSGVNFSVTGDHQDYLCVMATDSASNTNYTLVGQLNIDNTAPNITSFTSDDSNNIVRDANTVTINAVFTESMASSPTINITYTNASCSDINTAMTGSGTTWTYLWNVPSSCESNATATVDGTDLAGKIYAGSDSITFVIDNTAPIITSFSLSDSEVYLNDIISGSCSAIDNIDLSVSTSINELDTNVAGSYEARCTATDDAGNSVLSTITYTVNNRLITFGKNKNLEPTDVAQSKIYEHLEKGINTVAFSKGGLGVLEVEFKTTKKADNVKIKATSFISKPDEIQELDKTYKYFEIEHTNLENEVIESAKIKFNVEKSWLSNNRYKKEDIVLQRLSIKWEELKTNLIGESDTAFIYEAETLGFSYFAVSVKGAEEKIITQPSEVEEEKFVDIVEKPKEDEELSVKIEQETQEEKKSGIIIITILILGLLIGGILVYYFIFNKEK